MSNLVEDVARSVWEKRRELAKKHSNIELEEWGDGEFPNLNHIMDEARAAIDCIRNWFDAEADTNPWDRHEMVMAAAALEGELDKPSEITPNQTSS